MQQTQRGRKIKKSQSSKKIRSQTEDPKKKSLNKKALCLKYYFVGPGNNGKLISNYLSQQSGWKLLDAESGKSSNDFYLKWVQTNSEIQFQQFKEGQYNQYKNNFVKMNNMKYMNLFYKYMLIYYLQVRRIDKFNYYIKQGVHKLHYYGKKSKWFCHFYFQTYIRLLRISKILYNIFLLRNCFM